LLKVKPVAVCWFDILNQQSANLLEVFVLLKSQEFLGQTHTIRHQRVSDIIEATIFQHQYQNIFNVL